MTAFRLAGKDFSATPVDTSYRSLLGGLLQGDWVQAFIERGYGWHTFGGAFSTPAAGGGAAAVIDQDQPRLCVSVPTGITMVPIRVDCQLQPPLTGADSEEIEIVFAVDRAAAYAGDGTVVSLTPTNMRTDIVSGCPLTCFKTASANITNPTLGIELGHAVKVSEVGSDIGRIWTDLTLRYEPVCPQFIVGPAALYVYFGGTQAVGGAFTQVDVLAFASTLVKDLA